MKFDAQRMPGERGIIIVDSSSLIMLCTKLEAKLLHSRAIAFNDTALSDTLFSLGRHGFEIVIPEAVAQQCANVMRDGTSTNVYFSKSHEKPVRKAAGSFLSRLERDEGNIRIAPPLADDMTEAARYVNAAWKIHMNKETFPKSSRVLDKHSLRTIVCKSLSGLDQEFPNRMRHGYGEDAACELVKHLDIREPSPVFYLSDSKEGRIRVAGANPNLKVNQLNVSGLYEALRVEGLLPLFGIGNRPFQEMSSYLRLASADPRENLPLVAGRADYFDPIDRIPPPFNHEKPFQHAIAGLREEIAAGRNTPQWPEKVVTEPGGRAAQFAKKWGLISGAPTDDIPGR